MSAKDYRRIQTVVGATGRKLRLQIRSKATGAAVDLTDYTSATLDSWFAGTTPNKILAKAMVIEVGVLGWVYYFPIAAEIDTAGDLLSRITLDPNTGTIDYTERFIIEVEDF